MFDFEKMRVYREAKSFNLSINKYLETTSVNKNHEYQLGRASLSIVLNIAEGAGRKTGKDKGHFYVMSRGSAFECAAILDLLYEDKKLSDDQYRMFKSSLETISKML